MAAENSAQNFERQTVPLDNGRLGHRPAEFPCCAPLLSYILPDSELSPLHIDAPTETTETPPIPIYHHACDGLPDRTLRDTLLTLAGQNLQDFGFTSSSTARWSRTCQRSALWWQVPPTLQARIHPVHSARSLRAIKRRHRSCQGSLCRRLDDDDFVFGHWVETFRDSREQPGAMLRAVCTRQDFLSHI